MQPLICAVFHRLFFVCLRHYFGDSLYIFKAGMGVRTLSVYMAPKNHMDFYTKQMSFNLKLDGELGMFLELEEESESLTDSFRALGVFRFDIHKSSKSN